MLWRRYDGDDVHLWSEACTCCGAGEGSSGWHAAPPCCLAASFDLRSNEQNLRIGNKKSKDQGLSSSMSEPGFRIKIKDSSPCFLQPTLISQTRTSSQKCLEKALLCLHFRFPLTWSSIGRSQNVLTSKVRERLFVQFLWSDMGISSKIPLSEGKD